MRFPFCPYTSKFAARSDDLEDDGLLLCPGFRAQV